MRARALSLVAASGALLFGCSQVLGYDDVGFGESGGSYGSGGSPSGGAPSGGGAAGSGGASSGGAGSGGTSSGGSSSGGAASGGAGSGGTSTTDPHEQARQTCVNKINALRATKGLPPYQRWTSAEACVDLQATDDEQTGTPHGAWSSKKFACNGYGSGQNECLGGGAAGIEGCLDMMWAEKDQPGCAGCDACTGPGGCANCDFYGTQTGDVCGHYVNMRATWFSMAACGFSSAGGWAAINFQ